MEFGITPRVLIVDDNPDDVELTRIAFEEAGVTVDLDVMEDGSDALDHLNAVAPKGTLPRPDLILLDLNLPRVDGRDVLKAVKADEALALIPIIVLSTSTDNEDVRFAYRNHAASFIVKPIVFDHFVETMKAIADFWFTAARLPGDAYDPYGQPT